MCGRDYGVKSVVVGGVGEGGGFIIRGHAALLRGTVLKCRVVTLLPNAEYDTRKEHFLLVLVWQCSPTMGLKTALSLLRIGGVGKRWLESWKSL